MTKSVSAKIKKQWLLLAAGALGVAGVVLSVGLAVSAAAPDIVAYVFLDESRGSLKLELARDVGEVRSAHFYIDFIDGSGDPSCDRASEYWNDSRNLPGGVLNGKSALYTMTPELMVSSLKESLERSGTQLGSVNPEDMFMCIEVHSTPPITNKYLFNYKSSYEDALDLWGKTWRKYTEIDVRQTGSTLVFSAPGSDVGQWRHRVIDAGETCAEADFSLPPNHPSLRSSDRLHIPEANLDGFRNKWVCLEVASRSGQKLYAFHDIDLGNPAINVRRSGDRLHVKSNEDVTWKAGWSTSQLIVAQREYHSLYAGSLCELVFTGAHASIASLVDFDGTSSQTDSVREFNVDMPAGAWHYCFEATDVDGNKTYLETRPEDPGRILIWYNSSITTVAHPNGGKARLLSFAPDVSTSTSGYVDWTILGPSHYERCNAANFGSANKDPKLSFREEKASAVVKYNRSLADLGGGGSSSYSYELWDLWSGSDENRYRSDYCIRAVDQLGRRYYRLFDAANPSFY